MMDLIQESKKATVGFEARKGQALIPSLTAKLLQSDSRQALRAGGFIRATPLGCLSPPQSPPPATRLSCLRVWEVGERGGGKKNILKKYKKKISPLAASAREVERASSGLPARPPPAAAWVSPQPLLCRRPRRAAAVRPPLCRSVHLPTPTRSSWVAVRDLRGGG